MDLRVQVFTEEGVIMDRQVPFDGDKSLKLKPEGMLFPGIFLKHVRCCFSKIGSINKDQCPLRV